MQGDAGKRARSVFWFPLAMRLSNDWVKRMTKRFNRPLRVSKLCFLRKRLSSNDAEFSSSNHTYRITMFSSSDKWSGVSIGLSSIRYVPESRVQQPLHPGNFLSNDGALTWSGKRIGLADKGEQRLRFEDRARRLTSYFYNYLRLTLDADAIFSLCSTETKSSQNNFPNFRVTE